ncbi:MAG: molybdopterin-dependent oxidoreductase [Polyangiaceae bacterium]
MERVATYCRICEAACGLVAEVEGQDVIALRPDRDHVVSRGFACAKGTRFTEVHRGAGRVNHPLRRSERGLERTTWSRAYADIGMSLRRIVDEHGPHAVGVYIGNPAAFSYTLPVYGVAFVRALGTRNYFSAGSLDCNNKFLVAKQMLGSSGTHPVPDLDRANFALLIGTNPAVSQSSFINAPRMVERLQGIVSRGGRVVVVDPRRSETARRVGEHLPITPGSDAALLLAMLEVILREGLYSSAKVAETTRGCEHLRSLVKAFAPAQVAEYTGIPAPTIENLARDFAAAPGAFCHVSTGVNQGRFGNIAYAAKIALEVLTGNLDRAGGALIVRGAADTAGLAARLGLDREPDHTSRIGGFSPVLGTLPAAILADEITTPGTDQIRALVCIAGNPVLSAPDGERLRRALARLELHVSIDLFVNDTGAHATHVLPATDFLEREDFPLAQLQLQPRPYVQWTEAVVTPFGERKPEWEILVDICRHAGLPLFGNRAADLALRAALRVGGPRALALPLLARALGLRPLAALRRSPHGIDLSARENPGWFLRTRRSNPIVLDAARVWTRLPELEAELRHRRRGLRLISRREALGHNSWMHDNPRLSLPEHAAYFSVRDSKRLGIESGDRVRLSVGSQSIELGARVDEDLVAGAVAVPHGYGHDAAASWRTAHSRGGCNVNQLCSADADALDPDSGMAQLVAVEIEARPVTRAAAEAKATVLGGGPKETTEM